MAVDTRKEAVENFIQSVLKDHVLSEGMPRTQSDTQDAYATVELLRSFLEKCDALEAQVKAADALADRLNTWSNDNLTDDNCRDWFGHVEPALSKYMQERVNAKD